MPLAASKGNMRRALLAAFLLFASSSLCLSAQALFFASDESGFRGEPVGGKAASDFVLEERSDAASKASILYKNGTEIERTLSTPLPSGWKSTHYLKGILTDETIYDASGALLEERQYAPLGDGKRLDAKPPLLARTLDYSYQGGRLLAVISKDGSAKEDGRLSYRYDSKGRLVELAASGSFGLSNIGIVPGSPAPSALLSSTGLAPRQLTTVHVYDSQGRPAGSETREADKLVQLEAFTYGEDSMIAHKKAEDLVRDLLVDTSYDSKGRATLIVNHAGDTETRRESLSYDGKGRILSDVVVQGKTEIRKDYVYDKGESLSIETTTIGDIVQAVVRSMKDGSIVKETYAGGSLVVASTYLGGRLVKEVYYTSGAITRTKEYR